MIRLSIFAVIFLTASGAGASESGEGDAGQFGGKWRVTRGVVAPWSDDASAGAPSLDIGAEVRFAPKSVAGPHPIGCRGAEYEATDVPAEGLFQGGLPSPADRAMMALGLSGPMVKGFSVRCDTGVFEYHRADGDTILLALDNRIWSLSRTAGTRASASLAEGVVQRFLEMHFAGDMGFWLPALENKRRYFTKSLNGAMDAYFAKISDSEEEPPINGDPFTDSQDLPTRFAVRADDRLVQGVSVPVDFADAYSSKSVGFVMAREKGRWRIDDLVFSDGTRLSALLAE